jgi:hypothetical protein
MHRGLIAGFVAIVAIAGPAGAAELAAVNDACTKNTTWTAAACDCMAKRATSLSGVQRDYVVAALNEDSAASAKAQAAMSIPEFSAVSSFMVNALSDCGNE